MNRLTITEIQIIPVKPNKGLVAFASCVINSQFYIGDIAIHTVPQGDDVRLVYPAKTLPNGKRINCVHPINREAGEALKQAIGGKYKEMTAKHEVL